MNKYVPEGDNPLQNEEITIKRLKSALETNEILQAKVDVCDNKHNLILNFNNIKGIIEKNECGIGIKENLVKDIAIISRVNKFISFKVKKLDKDENGNNIVYLSRTDAQQECMKNYISQLKVGNIIEARVTHLDNFGAFVDIGCGIISLIPIDLISVSRISHPKDRFFINQKIMVIIKSISSDGKICLSHKELLGTWMQNAEMFNIGETVKGIVRSVEKYGVFIELSPNLAGLSEYTNNVNIGDLATVYIKNIIPEKMKIKLVLIDTYKNDETYKPFKYFIDEKHMNYWKYSPFDSNKKIETYF